MAHIMLRSLLFLLLACIISFFYCCFSPISELAGHADPGCFYMAGKAWAYGLIPYVGTIDIKGPLLFAFFAAGYLIHGTFGVYLLVTLCLYASILGVYHIAKLHTLSEAYSVLIVAAFLFGYLLKFHPEGRAEDIMLPALVWSIFVCLNSILHPNDVRRFYAAARVLGVNAALISLVKYNALLPLVCCALLMLFFAVHNSALRGGMLRFIQTGCLYFIIIITLMAGFLYTQGALYPCIDVYCNVVRAASMTSNGFHDRMLVLMIAVLLLGMWLISAADRPQTAQWTAALWSAYALGAYGACCMGSHYYFIIGVPLIVFPFIAAEPRFSKILSSQGIYIGWVAALALGGALYPGMRNAWSRIQMPEKSQNPFDAEIAKVRNARILYIGTLDLGLGARSDALPACPFWMTLNGDVFKSYEKQWQCLEKRIPDFVIIPTYADWDTRVKQCGYARIEEGRIGDYMISLWRRE